MCGAVFLWLETRSTNVGDVDPGTGAESLVATPSGRFLFGAVLLNGTDQAGIFIDKP